MEKKKLLLVAVSVGVFLVVVVGAAILIFKPGLPADGGEITYRQIAADEPNRSATTDAVDMIRDDSFRGLQDPVDTVSPIQENRIYANGESSGNEAQTVINVPKPSVPAVPDTPQAKPSPSKPVPAAKPPAAVKPAPAKPAPAKPVPAARSAPPEPKRSYHDFWVQAGSFSTRERADGVKHTLDDKGIAAIITNQEINGNTYYRVRVGPYTSQNEADYWLAMIKTIDGFQDSQVWESRSLR